jgi:putative membrane protein
MKLPEEEKSELRFEHARDHLANERTFLAWIRTSLAIIGLGFVIVKFSLFVKEIEMVMQKQIPFRHNTYSLVMGILLVTIGGLIIVVAYLRFKQTQNDMRLGRFEQSSWPLRLLTILLVLASVLLIYYLIATT